jgi:ATP synthase subunit 6
LRAGQNSTYYGKIEDMVIAQEYVTPIGLFRTPEYPRSATGPDFDQIMIGSEGTFGILINVTLKVYRYAPENTRRFSYLFKNWEDGCNACREIMQGEFGYPSIFRLSDQEETDVAMRTYHVHGTPADALLRWRGYQPMKRCLLLGTSDGDADLTRLVAQKVKRICKSYRAFTLTPFKVTQAWERSRFTDPFMREVLMDYGIMIDTLECAVTWSQIAEVHEKVRSFIKNRPHTVCMSHLSHAYPQGGNLYFIFVARLEDINEYITLQYGILEAILKTGAAVSHHHGIGKQTGPWLEEQIGTHIGEHVLYTWFVMLVLILVAFAASRAMKMVPGGLQNFMEVVVSGVENLIEETMGHKGKAYFPLIATFALLILVSNLIALIPGFMPPTANLNTNGALALTVFAMTHIVGVKEHGISYLKHFMGPILVLAPLMFIIEIIGHLARPLSLSLRLFGNMYGHEIVLMIFFALVPFLLPVPMMLMGVLVACIQTFVFTLLAMIYIAGALEEAH